MPESFHVTQPPDRPVLIFDGDCGFCRYWVWRWQHVTEDRIEYRPLQDPALPNRFPELPRSNLEAAVHLVQPGGRVVQGAEAVFRALAYNPSWRWPLWTYQRLPGVAPLTESTYRFVARHRTAFSFVTRLLWGAAPPEGPPSYALTGRLFLAGLGLIYLVALVSLWVQLDGLIGPRGVLPAAQFLDGAREYFTQVHVGMRRYALLPTWCWISAGSTFLHALCLGGVVCAGLLICGIAPGPSAFFLWSIYLSLTVVGREFLSFQWDALLLEAGFVGMLFSPWRLFPVWRAVPSRALIWLLRWLLFRLMFESGCVKLLSGDPAWQRLTALQYHFETQPLPTWIGWHAHHASAHFQQACAGILFGIELALPFFIFGPRRLRLTACVGFIVLQVWILLTGNYAFFNYLAILLALTLLDDGAFRRFLSAKGHGGGVKPPDAAKAGAGVPSPASSAPVGSATRRPAWPGGLKWLRRGMVAVLLVLGITQVVALFGGAWMMVAPVRALAGWVAPFRMVNSYGLFAIMTTARPEIIIEGSADKVTWKAYQFRHKPGPLTRAPDFVAPHQPRLDWQMWFAALGTPQENAWFINLCVRLLEGDGDVLALLETNPFPNRPPLYVRALVYRYHFTSPAERRAMGAWWKREPAGTYLPAISLRAARDAPGA